MTRRRARAVMKTELPIKASPVELFTEKVRGALELLPQADSGAVTRLTGIARIFHDRRRIAAQRVSRPDSRKSLEAIAELAGAVCNAIQLLPEEHRVLLGSMLERHLAKSRRWILPSELGRALTEAAELDLERWGPSNAGELGPILECFGLSTGELGDRCAHLPQDAEWGLIELQQHVSLLPQKADVAEYLLHIRERIGQFGWVAAELMKSDRGPRSDTAQMMAVLALKDEFERTGQTVSHSSRGDRRAYSGISKSPFGRFVHRFFADIDPEDSQRRGLDDAIAFACWPSRTAARKPVVERETEQRHRKIQELLKSAGVTNFSAQRDSMPD